MPGNVFNNPIVPDPNKPTAPNPEWFGPGAPSGVNTDNPWGVTLDSKKFGNAFYSQDVKTQMKSQGYYLVASPIPGKMDVISPDKAYWTNPKHITAYHKIISTDKNWVAPTWLPTRDIEEAYKYLSFTNKGIPEENWTIAPDDPAFGYLSQLQAPPTEFWFPEEVRQLQKDQEQQVNYSKDLDGWQQFLIGFGGRAPEKIFKPDGEMVTAGVLGKNLLAGVSMGFMIGTVAAPLAIPVGLAIFVANMYQDITGKNVPIISDTLGVVGKVFSLGSSAVEQVIGITEQAFHDDESWNEVFGNYEAARKAAESTYETTGGSAIFNAIEGIYHFATGTPDKATYAGANEVWAFDKGNPNPIKIDGPVGFDAMEFARRQIASGMDGDSVLATITEKFGVQGFFNDYVLQNALDPLNGIPYLSTKLAGKIGGSDLISGMFGLEEGYRGALINASRANTGNIFVDFLPQGLNAIPPLLNKKWRASGGIISTLKTADTFYNFGFLDASHIPNKSLGDAAAKANMLQSISTEGENIGQLKYMGKDGLSNTGWWGRFVSKQTPAAKYQMFINNAMDYLSTLNASVKDPDTLIKNFKAVAGVNAKDTINVIQKTLDDNGLLFRPETFNSQVGLTVAAAFANRKFLATLDGLRIEWANTKDIRFMVEDWSKKIGINSDALVAQLRKEADLPLYLTSHGIDIADNDLAIRTKLKPFLEGSSPHNADMFKTKLLSTTWGHLDAYGTDYFNISPLGKVARLSNVLKHVQSFFVLGLNPRYLMYNFINNAVTRIADGSFAQFTPDAIENFVGKGSNSLGIEISATRVTPKERARFNMDITEGGSPEYSKAMVPELDAIDKAASSDLIKYMKKASVTSRLSGAIEAQAGWQAYLTGLYHAWTNLNTEGVGRSAPDAALSALLGEGFTARMRDVLDGSRNIEAAYKALELGVLKADAVVNKLSKDYAGRLPGVKAENAAIIKEALTSSGLVEKINGYLPIDRIPTEADIADAIFRTRNDIQAQIRKSNALNKTDFLQHIKNASQVEGHEAAFDIFAEATLLHQQQMLKQLTVDDTAFEDMSGLDGKTRNAIYESKRQIEAENREYVRQRQRDALWAIAQTHGNLDLEDIGFVNPIFYLPVAGSKEYRYLKKYLPNSLVNRASDGFPMGRKETIASMERFTGLKIIAMDSTSDVLVAGTLSSLLIAHKSFDKNVPLIVGHAEGIGDTWRFTAADNRSPGRLVADVVEENGGVAYVMACDDNVIRTNVQLDGRLVKTQSYGKELINAFDQMNKNFDDAFNAKDAEWAKYYKTNKDNMTTEQVGKYVEGIRRRDQQRVALAWREHQTLRAKFDEILISTFPTDARPQIKKWRNEYAMVENEMKVAENAYYKDLLDNPPKTPAEKYSRYYDWVLNVYNPGILKLSDVDMRYATRLVTPPLEGGLAHYELYNKLFDPMLDDIQIRLTKEVKAGNFPGLKDLAPEARAAAMKYLKKVEYEWNGTKLASMKYGEAIRDDAMLNYNQRGGMDDALGILYPYQFWYTRSMRNWAMRMIDHPAIFAQYGRLMQLRERMQQAGIPARFDGKIRQPMAFLPEWMGGGIWFDPYSQIFPFVQFGNSLNKPSEISDAVVRGAIYNINDMVSAGRITRDEGEKAKKEMTGVIWAEAYSKSEEENNLDNPITLASMLMTPALYLDAPYKLLKGEPEKIPVTPMGRTLQSIQGGFRAAGVEPGSTIDNIVGVPAGAETWMRQKVLGLSKAQALMGQWGDWYVERQLANMVEEKVINSDDAWLAMMDKSGPVYDKAFNRTMEELNLRNPLVLPFYAANGKASVGEIASATLFSLFPAGILPEGELKYKNHLIENKYAWDMLAKGDKRPIADFYAKYPEYQVRSALGIGDPKLRLQQYLIGAVWNKYSALSEADKQNAIAQLGDEFNNAFLNKATQNEESVPNSTLEQWLWALGGKPSTATNAQFTEEQRPRIEMWSPSIQKKYQQFTDERNSKFPNWYALQTQFYALPYGSRSTFNKKFPEFAEYQQFKADFIADNPELEAVFTAKSELSNMNVIKGYMSPEELATLPPQVISALYQHYTNGAIIQTGAWEALYDYWVSIGKPGVKFQTWMDNEVKPTFSPV